MAKNTGKLKATKIPKPKTIQRKIFLPFNGSLTEHQGITFSFSSFDHSNKLFNLGGNEKDGTVGGKWFIRLFDCLKNVSGKTVVELKQKPYCLHPVNWESANVSCPLPLKQAEYWQFRVDKSHGRVIGILIDSVFYVVWLDPHHNLTDSEGYGGAVKFKNFK